jgi:serine/threonine-protein kinase
MASVHTARLVGAEGFTRLVAAKRLHPQFADDPDFVEMFLDEARIASKIHHPNVVPVLDVVLAGSEVILVQEYVHGVPLSQLFRIALANEAPIPVPIVVAVVTGVLAGLHAAHEAKDERGVSLDVVHRDVSPQNVIVSIDGVPRLLDFGIAKARTSAHVTLEGFFKGKIAYMGPEQLRMERVTRKADIYAAGVLMWELLAHRRLHSRHQRETEFVAIVVNGGIPALSIALEQARASATIPDERWKSIITLERIVGRALATSPDDRWETAEEMAEAILAASHAASAAEVAHWVRSAGAAYLAQREESIAASEESVSSTASGAHQLTSGVMPANKPAAPAPQPTAPDLPPLQSREEKFAMRLAPWIAVGALLVIVGALGGIVASRGVDAPAAASVTPIAGPIVTVSPAPAPTPTVTETATASAIPSVAPLPPPPKPPAPIFFAPARIAPPPPPPPKPTPPPSSTKTNDCNPPFFFDGNKKVFKPNCI